jgi:hypothetical protein
MVPIKNSINKIPNGFFFCVYLCLHSLPILKFSTAEWMMGTWRKEPLVVPFPQGINKCVWKEKRDEEGKGGVATWPVFFFLLKPNSNNLSVYRFFQASK